MFVNVSTEDGRFGQSYWCMWCINALDKMDREDLSIGFDCGEVMDQMPEHFPDWFTRGRDYW